MEWILGIISAAAGIFGALAGAVVGGLIGWVGAYHVAVKADERRERREAKRAEEDARKRDKRTRTAISAAVESFLLEWGRALKYTSPGIPIDEKQLEGLAADVAEFRTFWRDLVDIQDEGWRGLYLDWLRDLNELHWALIALSHKPLDPTDPMLKMDETLRKEAGDVVHRVAITLGDKLRLG